MQTNQYRTQRQSSDLWQNFNEQGLQFQLGVLSINTVNDRFDLITPEGERLSLNPRLSRNALVHLHQQPVRALLRAIPWPLVRGVDSGHQPQLHHAPKISYDVLFVERLNEPPELENLEIEELPASFNWESESEHDGAFAS